ncbi:MAG: hypothetical protein IT355_03130 [Gemmatimonadaceae bacterium]|nr:hypothetical protein [Gemmatimonadaceae bacterium]
MIFRRRPSNSQLIVSTNALRRMPNKMPEPQGPILPMSELAQRAGAAPRADSLAAVRDSGVVIAFLASGATRAHLTTRVYDVITAQEGCGLGRSSSLQSFADQFCETPDGKRRLAQALSVIRPTPDPTAQLTRASITAWVRSVGLAAQAHEAAEATTAGLPDWHVPGDM